MSQTADALADHPRCWRPPPRSGGAGAAVSASATRPATLCIYERYPYLVVLAACGLGLWLGRPRLALAVAALALAVNVGLAGYHVGVEQGWLALPQSCAAVGEAVTIEELQAQLEAAPARCDQVPLTVAGLSLAAWNGLYRGGSAGRLAVRAAASRRLSS